MPKSVYFVNCLEGIRHTTYGRDNRKPIAGALESLHDAHLNDAIELVEKEALRVNVIEPVHNPGQKEDYYTLSIRRPID